VRQDNQRRPTIALLWRAFRGNASDLKRELGEGDIPSEETSIGLEPKLLLTDADLAFWKRVTHPSTIRVKLAGRVLTLLAIVEIAMVLIALSRNSPIHGKVQRTFVGVAFGVIIALTVAVLLLLPHRSFYAWDKEQPDKPRRRRLGLWWKAGARHRYFAFSLGGLGLLVLKVGHPGFVSSTSNWPSVYINLGTSLLVTAGGYSILSLQVFFKRRADLAKEIDSVLARIRMALPLDDAAIEQLISRILLGVGTFGYVVPIIDPDACLAVQHLYRIYRDPRLLVDMLDLTHQRLGGRYLPPRGWWKAQASALKGTDDEVAARLERSFCLALSFSNSLPRDQLEMLASAVRGNAQTAATETWDLIKTHVERDLEAVRPRRKV
jgi:hypothetical protein